jgi:protein-disulfide isomerase
VDTTRRNGLVAVAVVAVIAIVVGVGYAVQAGRDTTGKDAAAPGQSSSPSTPSTGTPSGSKASTAGNPGVADTYGVGIGDPKAPVKVEVFEDFLCPYCRQFESASRDDLRQAAIDGKAYVVYRPIAFLNEYSTRSLNAFGVVLDTSGGATALKFHDLLYENQPEEGGTMPDDDWLIGKAVEAGAKEAAIRPGIEKLSFKQWMINGNDDASQRGVNSTPTVFVNGDQVSGSSIEDLAAQVQERIDSGS